METELKSTASKRNGGCVLLLEDSEKWGRRGDCALLPSLVTPPNSIEGLKRNRNPAIKKRQAVLERKKG